MAARLTRGVRGGRARLVSDGQYIDAAEGMLAHAVRRALCSIFIIDLTPARDPLLRVDGLLHALAGAAWRGVDARLVIGGSRTNLDIARLADAARARALSLGIPTHWLTSTEDRGSHMKLIVADDQVLTGSHNWSSGALGSQVQDSVLVDSVDLAAHCAALFERQWDLRPVGVTP